MVDLSDIEKLAKDHKQCPETANPADLCYYWTMRNVYDGYRAKKVSVDDAKAAKRQAIIQHEQFSVVLSNALIVHKSREAAIHKIGDLRTALHSAGDLDSKYRIALKAITAMTGENVTEKMEAKWLESIQPENNHAESEAGD